MQAEAAAKKAKEESKEEVKVSSGGLPPVEQKAKPGFDLPPVMMKKYGAGFEFDQELLKEQQKNIQKMNALKEFDELEEKLSKKDQETDGKSLKDLLKEKRENTEKVIESKNVA